MGSKLSTRFQMLLGAISVLALVLNSSKGQELPLEQIELYPSSSDAIGIPDLTLPSPLPTEARTETLTETSELPPSLIYPVEVDPIATQASIELVSPEAELPVASVVDMSAEEKRSVGFGDWLGYNATQHDTTWLAGNGDEFGWFSMESFPVLEVGEDSSFVVGSGVHFLNGPVATDMPARLFDFQAALQWRKKYSANFMLDAKLGLGAFSDFEGSARKGIRFPSHAVSYYEWDSWLVSVLGVEFLDRDDVNLLPVVGFVWRPREDLIAELVFPRPRIQLRTDENTAMYISGELGGGTWAIERSDATNDNATYRDLRVMLGFMEFDGDEDETALEIGWAFSRALEYRSARGNFNADDVFVLRLRQHY